MLTPEIKKKLTLFFAVPAAILMIIFIIFGVILNHGTVIITAKAPYEISTNNGQKIQCSKAECSITMKPGSYTFTISKPNFQDWIQDINVGYNKTTKLTANLIYQPQISEINPSQLPLAPFSRIQNTQHEIFVDEIGKNGMYLTTDAKTGRQSLMVGELDQESGREKLMKNPKDRTALKNTIEVASFIREVKSSIFSSNDATKTIAMVDQSGPGSEKIYFIDRTTKSRDYIGEMDVVNDFRLLPNDQLLMWGKYGGKFDTVILLDPKTQKITDLHLNTSLHNIVFINGSRLIAATNQALDDMTAPEHFEGHAVQLGDPQDQYTFWVDYSLDQPQPHLIKAMKGDLNINGMILNDAKNTLYFALGVNGQAYKLQFDDDAAQ